MKVALLQFDLEIHDTESLKDKRRVVKSLKDRLHREDMVSIAEIGLLDNMHAARLGLACVGNSVPHLQSVLDRIIAKLKTTPGASLGATFKEILHGDGSGDLGFGGEELDDDTEPMPTPEELLRSTAAPDDDGDLPPTFPISASLLRPATPLRNQPEQTP